MKVEEHIFEIRFILLLAGMQNFHNCLFRMTARVLIDVFGKMSSDIFDVGAVTGHTFRLVRHRGQIRCGSLQRASSPHAGFPNQIYLISLGATNMQAANTEAAG